MGIAPAPIPGLLAAYEKLTSTSQSLVRAAAEIAPSAVADVICQIGGLTSLLAGPLGQFQSPGTGNRLLSDMGALGQAACLTPPPPPSLPPPPFTGGQCPTMYSVAYFYKRVNAQGVIGPEQAPPFTASAVMGPISGITPQLPGQIRETELFRRVLINGNPDKVAQNFAQSEGFVDLRIGTVTRIDGLPDDCGDPPPGPAPPRPPIPDLPASPTIPDDRPGGGGGYIFKPTVGPIVIDGDGGISVPVVINVSGPSLTIPITIPVSVNLPDFAPTVNIGGSGGNPAPGEPSDPSDPPTPLPPICCEPIPEVGEPIEGEPDEPLEEEDPPEGRKLVGLIVNSTVNEAVAKATRIFQTSAQRSLWVPRLGNVYFGVVGITAAGNPVVSESVDQAIKLTSQYFPAPPEIINGGWRVVPEAGVSLRITPVYIATNVKIPAEAE